MMFILHNENCFETMERMPDGRIDVILTSPPYNTNKKASNGRTNQTVYCPEYHCIRYDSYVDNVPNDEYINMTIRLFLSFNRILIKNGVILYNMNYGSENTECLFRAISSVIEHTPFTVADVIGWKKKTAFPITTSPNKLTRLFEFVFVICRKEEIKTFYCNRRITSYRANGQPAYENIFNYIEARNNDGACKLNSATYSSELCEKLLKLYAPPRATVYDPFIGTGTTAIAAYNLGMRCIGSELSSAQCEYAKARYTQNGGDCTLFSERRHNNVGG